MKFTAIFLLLTSFSTFSMQQSVQNNGLHQRHTAPSKQEMSEHESELFHYWKGKKCVICHGGLIKKEGQIIEKGGYFQAYCGHIYHYLCLQDTVKYGHKNCHCGKEILRYDSRYVAEPAVNQVSEEESMNCEDNCIFSCLAIQKKILTFAFDFADYAHETVKEAEPF